jgi:hypothetical protein
VYEGALEGYQQIVARWFQSVAPRLPTAATLPAAIVGVVVPRHPGRGLGAGPTIRWHLEPLPFGSKSTVNFRLTDDEAEIDVRSFDLGSLATRLRTARPEAGTWISPEVCWEALDIFHVSPATELVYDWLWRDLKKIDWVKGLLGGR